jgi:hypothetical protein
MYNEKQMYIQTTLFPEEYDMLVWEQIPFSPFIISLPVYQNSLGSVKLETFVDIFEQMFIV